ncbi:MAG: outer membrane beta-barrel protein [Ferruginibacter sp.]
MRKLLVVLIALVAFAPAFSQTTTPKNKKKFNLAGRAGDHFMLQVSRDSWSGAADSVQGRIKSFSRGFNSYLMLDLPFKTDQRFSVGLGVGVSTSSIGFKNTNVDLSSRTPYLPFIAADSIEHYKKFKIATSYLEVPLELRFTANPETPAKTFKIAIGAKVGTLVNAHSKGKTLLDGLGKERGSFISKINSKSYFNSTKFAGTVRVGYGYFSLFAAYNFTTIFKETVAPNTRLLQLGLTISGL